MSIQNEEGMCPKCGQKGAIRMLGHIEEFHCDVCGWIQRSTVYPGEDVGLIKEETEFVDVRIEWTQGSVQHEELIVARRTFETLARIPLGELLADANKSPSRNLGTYPLPVAIELQEKGKANGLHVAFRKTSKPGRS